MRDVPLIEPLESRIAPAAVISPDGKTASYTDTNGDLVKITTSAGSFAPSQFTFDSNHSGQLTELNLTGPANFNGSNITFTVTPPANQVNTLLSVGYVDALGVNLKSLTLPGDLGRIDVGGGATAVAIGKLSLGSLGVNGTASQAGLATPTTISNITGTASLVQLTGNLDGTLHAGDYKSHPGTGNIGVLNIGGSLDGSNSSALLQMGEVAFSGKLGKVTIGGGIKGGASDFSGSLNGAFGTFASIGSVAVLGSVPNDPFPSPLQNVPGTSILGSAGNETGFISAVSIGSVTVAGDVRGDTGHESGFIQGGTALGTVQIGGSLIGGNLGGFTRDAIFSGSVFGGNIKSVTIAGSIYGGSGLDSGQISTPGLLQSAKVSGDVIGGSAGQTVTNIYSQTYAISGFSGSISGHAIGSVTISGSLRGGDAVDGLSYELGSYSGSMTSDTSIGQVLVGKNILGGSGPNSGVVLAKNGNLTSLVVGGANATDGSIRGGSGSNSGEVGVTGSIGTVMLTHDLLGGAGNNSGQIVAHGAVTSLTIGGSITGGAGNFTGNVAILGAAKSIVIDGNFTGGNSGATALTNSGYIQAGSIGALKIAGAFTSGTPGAGVEDSCGAIRADHTIGSLSIGSIMGNAANPAIISAVGVANLSASSKTDVAIGSIAVAGSSTYADILAGYSADTNQGSLLGTGVSADAQIGTVTIGGNLTGTNIVAGVSTANLGTAGSAALSGAGVTDFSSIVSKISSIVIKGAVIPTAAGGDAFGIAAQSIGAATVTGANLALLPGAHNDTFAAARDQQLPAGSGDEFLYEV